MMQFIKNNLLIVGGFLVVALGLGYYLFAYSGSPASPISSAAGGASASVSQQLLVTLTNLQTIQLNGAIFSDPAFQSLSNFSVSIPSQPAGRQNPFVPFVSASTPVSTSTQNIVLPGR